MASVISREEADKIHGNFEKIASRDDKKATGSQVKLVIAVVSVLIIIMLILVVLYFKGSLTGKLLKTSNSVTVQDGNSFNQGPQMPQALFGGEPINLSNRE